MNTPSVVQTLADLVRINSVNPAYEAGVSEVGVADYVERFFEALGIETWRQEVFPGRPNLIARIPGRNPSRRIILEAHMDTVSIQGMTIPPFDPQISDGRLYGRGSCDTKAGLAGMMHALARWKVAGAMPQCEVWLAAVVDEEFSFRGVVKLCEGLAGAAAIIAEPTELRLVTASKGVLRWRIKVRGRSAHSSKPHLGVNAISHMARLVLEIEKEHERLSSDVHPLLGPATCNVGVIRGGVQVNFVPDECVIEIDRRLLPGEQADSVIHHFQKMIDGLTRQHSDFVAEQEIPMLVDEALATGSEEGVVRIAGRVLSGLGLGSEPTGVPFGSDASKLSRQGIPSIIFGPGSIDRAHSSREYVETDQVIQAAEFYYHFIREFE